MKLNNKYYIITFLVAIISINCSCSSYLYYENYSSLRITYIDSSSYKNYNLFIAENYDNIIYYIISNKHNFIEELNNKNLDLQKIKINKTYKLKLIPNDSIKHIELIQKQQSKIIIAYDERSNYVWYDDTLRVPTYTTPNIIDKYFIVR